MMKAFFLGAALATAIAAPAFAQTMTAKEYVKTAGASDLFELKSSKAVLSTTQDDRVKSFANMMITDHTKSTALVKAAARKAGVKAPPPMLTPEQTDNLNQLLAAAGPARDAAYLAQQKDAHQQALTVQQGYASDGTAKPLRLAAAKIVPVVQHHIEMLNAM